MSSYPPEIRAFVKRFALNFVGSLRTTLQLEKSYRALAYKVKRATTQELDHIAERLTDHLLSSVPSLADLGALNDDFLRDALLRALDDDSKG